MTLRRNEKFRGDLSIVVLLPRVATSPALETSAPTSAGFPGTLSFSPYPQQSRCRGTRNRRIATLRVRRSSSCVYCTPRSSLKHRARRLYGSEDNRLCFPASGGRLDHNAS